MVEADGTRLLTHKGTSKTQHLGRRRRFPKQTSEGKPLTVKQLKFPVRRNGQKQVHHGRALFLVGRNSGKSVMRPLKPKSVKNKGPPPPETKAEVMRALDKHVERSSCMGSGLPGQRKGSGCHGEEAEASAH